MVNFLIFVSLLIAGLAQAAVVPSGVPQAVLGSTASVSGSLTVTPGAFTGTGTNGLFRVYAGDSSGALTASNHYPFYKNGTAWQAGANGAYCFNMIAANGTAQQQFQLSSDTVPIAFGATNASLTAAKYQSGAAGRYVLVTNAGTSPVHTPIEGWWKFGANVYPAFQAGASTNFFISMTCFEP